MTSREWATATASKLPVAARPMSSLAAVVDRCLRKHKEERFPDAHSLLRALEPFLPGRVGRELRLDESPYAGLSSFQEADADRFFGRTREIAALVNRIQDRPLSEVGGKGLWTKELDRCLLDGRTDVSVHSMKDVETIRPRELVVAAMLSRANVCDRLIGAESLDALPQGSVVRRRPRPRA